jgi:hypothetical protein
MSFRKFVSSFFESLHFEVNETDPFYAILEECLEDRKIQFGLAVDWGNKGMRLLVGEGGNYL